MNQQLLKGLSISLYSLLLSSLWADPLTYANKMGSNVVNLEATVPPQCYTKTQGLYNPCWVCHTDSSGLNQMNDWGLQMEYAFPETLVYFERAGSGDEFRNNHEWLQRFSPQGQIDESLFYNASVGGTKDLRSLLMPSPKRAMALNRAYLKIVRQQSFTKGRDAQVTLPENVHRHLNNGDTDLKGAGRVFRDGVLWLDWDWSPLP
jgi:hypothetical protein